MVRTRRQAAFAVQLAAGAVLQHPVVWDYVGPKRYLQVAVSKTISQLYVSRFDTRTSKILSYTAAHDGCLELLIWTRIIGCYWDNTVFIHACAGNRVNILKHLLGDECLQPDETTAYIFAAEKGSIAAIQCLREHDFSWNEDVCRIAAERGQLETLQYLFENGCPRPEDLGALACLSGRLEVVQWVHTQGCVLDEEAAHKAAVSGSLEILQWLSANGYPLYEDICGHAGSLTVLEWLHSQGYPLKETATYNAVHSLDMESLRWLHAHNAPVDVRLHAY